MSRLPALKPEEVIRKLKRFGFSVDRITGSHYILRHEDGRIVVVPYHAGRDVKRGTLRSILQQAGISVDDFTEA
ncbi:MAG: type II toxin-antitoxin system HicA family toxin [Fimbriimonadales bacterium]|nr:type II toxin-antitoxin system HicA family toxin [Fimbriimonadales bacterium]